jgi:hypothetical protein
VFTSATIATRSCVLVSPTSVPGAAAPEAGVLAELCADPVAAGADDVGAGEAGADDVLLDDEQPAIRTIAASPLAAMPSSRYRRERGAARRAPILILLREREYDSLFHFIMLRLYN